jgi:sialate O-acetylesterase
MGNIEKRIGMKQFLFVLLFSPVFAEAQLQLATIFSHHMVLQRNQPIQIWGKGIPGNTVSVAFGNELGQSIVQTDATWLVVLSKQPANSLPQQLTVSSGNEKIILQNIVVGDVWVCIGQSNMEWPMAKESHFKEEKPLSNNPKLRLYNPTYAGKNTYNTSFTDSVAALLTTKDFYKGHWEVSDSNTISTMSAVGYYFGKEIVTNASIPVGLINFSIGGAPLESFISTNAMRNSTQFSNKVDGNWLENIALPVWIKERGRQNVGNIATVAADANGKNHGFKPGFAFESGIASILNMPIKGILCYQGESNAQEIERVNEYADLSVLMIDDYRKQWHQPEMPFYFVQLSSIDTLHYKGQLWGQFRDVQRAILNQIPYSGMAVCSDIGFKDDVHPTNKKAVGERLARWALHQTYHKKILPCGPLPLKATYAKGKIIIHFAYSGGNLHTSNQQKLQGFSIDGKSDIEATIQRHQVQIAIGNKPEAVYYGWKPFSDGNLVNAENLPASTFKIKLK